MIDFYVKVMIDFYRLTIMKKVLAIAVAVVVVVEAAACIMKTYNDNRLKELKITEANIEKEIKLLELQLEWLEKGDLAFIM